MSGFETYNIDGVNIINSEIPSVTVIEKVKLTSLAKDINGLPFGRGLPKFDTPLGMYDNMSMPNEFLNSDKIYPPQQRYGDEDLSVMIRLNEGKRMCSLGYLTDEDAGDAIFVSTKTPVSSGYLDVFDSKGNLTWSAVHASKVPRIAGFIDIPPGFPLNKQIHETHIGYSPYIIYGSVPGSSAGDTGSSFKMGVFMMFKYSKGVIHVCCAEYSGTWWDALQNNGVRIPYAILPSMD